MKQAFQTITKERTSFILMIVIALMAVVFSLVVAFSVHPSDLQVVTHYSSFGDTNFYRNRWYYLLTFIVAAITVAVGHIGLMMKLLQLEKRHVAIFIGALGIIILVIGFILTHSVLQIASLA